MAPWNRFLFCVVVLTIAARGSTVSAEEKTARPPAPARFCLDGRRAPACDLIPLVETGFRLDFAEGRIPWTLSVGLLFNVARPSGVGFTADLRLGDQFPRWALRARYRHWLTARIGLDVAAGPTFPKSGLAEGHSDYGVAVGGAIDLGGFIAVTTDVDLFDSGQGREYSATFGVRFGSGVVLRALGVTLLQAATSKPRRPRWMGGE